VIPDILMSKIFRACPRVCPAAAHTHTGSGYTLLCRPHTQKPSHRRHTAAIPHAGVISAIKAVQYVSVTIARQSFYQFFYVQGSMYNIIFEPHTTKFFMNREELLEKTFQNLQKLPEQKLKEVSDFAEFLLNKVDNDITVAGIQKLFEASKTFNFLENEQEIYSVNDLKERYK
jgi:hypothetical protein